MGNADPTLTLYSSQAGAVHTALFRDGVCFSKRAYVQKKYVESAPVFITAYDWFVQAAQSYLPRPEGAEYPYWAFFDLYSLESSDEQSILTLRVPVDEAVYFDMYDWYKILRMEYMGETEAEEKAFADELAACGLRGTDVMLTSFHPAWKARIQKSWQRLFRHHAAIKAGDTTGVRSVQAALWQIKKEWIQET